MDQYFQLKMYEISIDNDIDLGCSRLSIGWLVNVKHGSNLLVIRN